MNFDLIIQARVFSSRLPGKVLLSLGDKTVLEFLINNLKKIDSINKIILAVPKNSNNTLFKKIAKKNKIKLFVSVDKNENNVLKRFYDCAKKFKSQNIIRITSDCPFINIYIVKKMIKYYSSHKLTFLTNNKPRHIPHGFDCEIFNFRLLKKAYLKAYKKSDLEHVTMWMYKNLKNEINNWLIYKKDFSKKRITLDNVDDYIYFLKKYSYLKKLSLVKNSENLIQKM